MGTTKTATVLHLDPDIDRTFLAVDDETGVIRRYLALDIATFQDLGEPATVTVTVEPGDTLND